MSWPESVCLRSDKWRGLGKAWRLLIMFAIHQGESGPSVETRSLEEFEREYPMASRPRLFTIKNRTRSCDACAFSDYFLFQWSWPFFFWCQPQELCCGCQCCQPQCSTSTWQEHFFFLSSLITMLLLCFLPPLDITTASSLITMFSLFSFFPASTLIASRATTSAKYLRSISTNVCGLDGRGRKARSRADFESWIIGKTNTTAVERRAKIKNQESSQLKWHTHCLKNKFAWSKRSGLLKSNW